MIVTRAKEFDQNRGDLEDWDSSRDGSHPSTPLAKTGKRKSADDRQPESPPEIERQHAPNNWHREKHFRSHPDPMDTDSPASYPKDVMVPSSEQRYRGHQSYLDGSSKGSMSTPVLTNEHGGMHGGYEHPSYRPSHYYQGHDVGHYQHTPPRQPRGHYMAEMEAPPSHYGPPPGQHDAYIRPRRWACDYCNVATFVSYEEACAHEDACARQYHERYGGRPHPSRGPVPQYDQPPPHSGRGGLGALYHASQELPPPPHARHQQMWGRGPPMPHLPPPEHHQPHYPPPHHQPLEYQTPPRYPAYLGYGGSDVHHRQPYQPSQKRMLLAMPSDSDSLSDRQCFVRSEMVEIFAATSKDVAARHSKGAQKLIEGQVGIRCVHCAHLRTRDRAERAVCYPSSISRIYQTVADMQRFHFEQCREIPPETRKIYKSLKTTRPRGVGSPQTYWIHTAKLLDLVDTECGIRFVNEVKQDEAPVSA
jgi:hypothetical protein